MTATQLGYYNFSSDYIRSYQNQHGGELPTVQTALQECGFQISSFIMRKFVEDTAFKHDAAVEALIPLLKQFSIYDTNPKSFNSTIFDDVYQTLKEACEHHIEINHDATLYELLLERITATYERFSAVTILSLTRFVSV